jgi:rhodanese-related sulfurtransferase
MKSLLQFKRIIDLRGIPEILKSGKIPNSKNIDFEKYKQDPIKALNLLKLSKNDPILFYCKSGKRSAHMTWLTKNLGYNAFNLDLGFKNHKYKFY